MSENNQKHTPGPWEIHQIKSKDREHPSRVYISGEGWHCLASVIVRLFGRKEGRPEGLANMRLIAAAPDLLAALHEGRRAIGDHFAPNDCYATGPLTGNNYRDLVECPACSFIRMHEAAIAKAEGRAE